MGTSGWRTRNPMRLVCCNTIMHFVVLATVIQLGSMRNYDPTNDLGEDDFRSQFGLDPITDPKLKAKRFKALKQHEEIIKKQNLQYDNGVKPWFDKLNEFSDLTDEEFVKAKTGLNPSPSDGYGRGLILHGPEMRDNRSEKYFDTFRYSRASVPRSYSSVDQGYVTPVRNQKQCGSCVSFTTIAMVETCFKKITGVFGDYSEQELVDCGYRKNYANGCNGAQMYSYTKWIVENRRKLSHENANPYLNTSPKLRCPRENPYRQGAQVSDQFFTDVGDEDMLKKLVYEHGAVGIALESDQTFGSYGGGILTGCSENRNRYQNHAVTVVGYGTEDGIDYWLIKNSWSEGWGDKGYIKVKRGVNACGIGWQIVTVDCKRTRGPTDAPQTTKEPCDDSYSDCPELAKTNCKDYGNKCRKSCGLCKGMTPHPSNTCPDYWPSCKTYFKNYCDHKEYKEKCCMSCKGVKIPCKDVWGDSCVSRRDEFCANAGWATMCKKTCGLCQ